MRVNAIRPYQDIIVGAYRIQRMRGQANMRTL
jgi:hypothetical protein